MLSDNQMKMPGRQHIILGLKGEIQNRGTRWEVISIYVVLKTMDMGVATAE